MKSKHACEKMTAGSTGGTDSVNAEQISISNVVIGVYAGKPSQAVVPVCLY